MECRDHPETIRRWETAHLEGSATDAGYSTREYALTLSSARRGHGAIVTLAACRFDDPDRAIRRVLTEWRMIR